MANPPLPSRWTALSRLVSSVCLAAIVGCGCAASSPASTASVPSNEHRVDQANTSQLVANQRRRPAERVEPIPSTFGNQRFSVKNVKVGLHGQVATVAAGAIVNVTMDLKHDCASCGNAVNQVIVGLGGEARAQVSVWNGKQRSGGGVRVVNGGTRVEALCEDNSGAAQWVGVKYQIQAPRDPGVYYIRTRYAQAYRGNLRTAAALKRNQPVFQKVLGWWRVDRPNGPRADANIGALIVTGTRTARH